MRKKAFTLLELITVVVIIGVLATLAIPNYLTLREKTLNGEAKANLKLIQAAEGISRMDNPPNYIDCTSSTNCNTNLSLALPAGAAKSWDYVVASATATDFNARATRQGSGAGSGRFWQINATAEEAYGCIGVYCN